MKGSVTLGFLLETNNLTKEFKGYKAVQNVNLQIEEGAVYGFLGPNGAGKTTTIRMLLGLMRPTEGEIKIFGKDMKKNKIDILKKIGSLVESPSYYGHLTGYENLEVTRKLLGLSKSHIVRVLKIVKLDDVAHRLVKKYSLGMKQRLGIALALLHRPALLILDEPTNGLDPSGIHEIRELIQRLPKEFGMTVLISSHNLSEIELIATHVGIIRKGKLLFQGTIGELQARNQPILKIETNYPKKVLEVLNSENIAAYLVENMIETKGHENAAFINKKIVEAGYDVSQLCLHPRSLEDIFLELTEEKETCS